jgi:hypothetical protein
MDCLTTPKEHLTVNDNQTLNAARTQYGYPVQTYDDGYGPLFILRDSMSILGIIRARTWEDAYEIAEDEFFPDADEEALDEMERIESLPEGKERDHAQACWDESYGHRPNWGAPDGRRTLEGTTSHIYAHDLNGEALDRLTPALMAELGIVLDITTEPEEPTP